MKTKIIIAIVLLFSGLVKAKTVLAVADISAESQAETVISLRASDQEAVVGKTMFWYLTITPSEQESISNVKINIGDEAVWLLLEDITQIYSGSEAQLFKLSVIPLKNGTCTPILHVSYETNKNKFSEIVFGESSINVIEPTKLMNYGFVTETGTVGIGDTVYIKFWIQNNTPFTISEVIVSGMGTDLEWSSNKEQAIKIVPGGFKEQSFSAEVIAKNPVPQFQVSVTFLDDKGDNITHTFYQKGEVIIFNEKLLDNISQQAWGLLIGVFAGVITSFFTNFLARKLDRQKQERVDKNRVNGLLRLVLFQAEHAAKNGIEFSTEPITTIFQESGLYSIAEQKSLGSLRELWELGNIHNAGLTTSGGTRRSNELVACAEKIRAEFFKKKLYEFNKL